MKKISFMIAFLLVVLACLCSCGEKGFDKNFASDELLAKVKEELKLPDSDEMYCDIEGEHTFLLDDDILSGKFGVLMDYPELDTIVKYSVYFSDDLYKTEFGVFLMTTEEQAENMKQYIASRISRMKSNAVNYPSVDTSLIDNYTVKTNGCFVYYGATESNTAFISTVESILKGN